MRTTSQVHVPNAAADTVKALALFAVLQAVWSDVHPVCDQIVQRGTDAIKKGERSPDGRRAAARHVLTYTAGQALAATVITRALGYRVPIKAAVAGHLINAITHFAIDRREPFIKVLRSRTLDKGGYLDHATVQRRPDVVDTAGPGTALFELDQAAHRFIGVAATLVTTWIATRPSRH